MSYILGQQFAWKSGNRYKKGFKVIYRVNSSLKGDIKFIE